MEVLNQNNFDKDGYLIIRGLLDNEQVAKYRNDIDRLRQERSSLNNNGTFAYADGVTATESFWNLIFNKKLHEVLNSTFNKPVFYTQHSDIHVNARGGRWHRDNAHRTYQKGPDWDESLGPYQVVRVAIYLSSYQDSGSSLYVLPGSHKKELRINGLELAFWNKMAVKVRNLKWNRSNWIPQYFFSQKKVKIKTQPGDCLIFDQRLVHAGGNLTGHESKYSIFLSFGTKSRHSINHREYYLSRPTYLKEVPKELRAKLEQTGLLLPEHI